MLRRPRPQRAAATSMASIRWGRPRHECGSSNRPTNVWSGKSGPCGGASPLLPIGSGANAPWRQAPRNINRSDVANSRAGAPGGAPGGPSLDVMRYDEPVPDGHDAIGTAGEVEIVRGDQRRRPFLADQRAEGLEHQFAGRRLAVASRLVGEV